MPRAALVIVPDVGAADVARAALAEEGIPVEVERAYPDHPYRATILAEPWQLFVPEERLTEARQVLARLEHEVADDLEAQASASVEPEEGPPSLGAGIRPPKISWAVALAILVPFPAVCFYARATRTGALFLGLFVASVGLALWQGVWGFALSDVAGWFDQGYEQAGGSFSAGERILLVSLGSKVGDLAVALMIITIRRRTATTPR